MRWVEHVLDVAGWGGGKKYAQGICGGKTVVKRPLTKYYWGDEINKNGLGGACSICGRQERCVQGFGGETSEKEPTWKTQA